jgi:phosphoglycerate dehydrogenase-like enzyme
VERRRPIVVLASNRQAMEQDVTEPDLARLRAFADFRFVELDRPTSWDEPPPPDAAADRALIEAARDADAIVVCHGAPRVTGEIMDACPGVRFIGELEGDRFARRIDTEAAWQRGVRTVDTTNGSSYGVSEWALAMALIGLRNAGMWFRRIIVDRQEQFYPEFLSDRGFRGGELTGKRVGLIGCGIIGRRLLELLQPFRCDIYIHDPYVPRELADAYDVTFTTLDNVLSIPDVIICLAPITPATRGMIGQRELDLIRDDAVFVNVSRGAIVQTDALERTLRTGRIVACLDVFDPEPIPVDSPVRDLPNVFLTPHIAGVNAAGGPRFFRIMVDELERFFGGHETRYDLLPRTIANRTGAEPPRRV